jgi:DNA-binding response OmpR family regulator
MTKSILILEDETMVQMFLEDFVEELGYTTFCASNLAQATKIVEEQELDLAILDVNLGDGTKSFPIAERLQELGIPFIFMSGYRSDTIDGFPDVPKLTKPIVTSKAEEIIKSILE